ncbi:MAG: carbohydrate kinase [Chloroflexi bacterium]|nr:carbohydrate kinase [Chloroflexota bacterium]
MDFVTLGELLMDMVPAETGRRLTEVSAFSPKPGGAPANVAVAGARLGARTAFLGKVGEDLFGHALAEVLKKEKVDLRGLRFDADARTTLALIAQPTANLNEYIFYRNPGADQRLRPDELDRDLLAHTRALHIGSLSLSDEPSRSATFEAVRLARQAGAFISFDVNFRPALWRAQADAVAQIAAMLPNADLLKVNETELELLTNTREVEAGSALLLARGPKLVVVTLGADGSYFRTAHASGYAKSFKVDAIDSTGCGDSFVGALLTQVVQFGLENIEAHIQDALRFANAAGAITSTRRGAIPALPTAQEVNEFLKKLLPHIGLLSADA